MNPRNAQGFFLPLGRLVAVPFVLRGVIQQACLLQDPLIVPSLPGTGILVTEFRLAGQSVMCSDHGAPIEMWAPDCVVEGHRGLSIPLAAQQEVVIETNQAAGTLSGGVGLRPILPDQVIPINQMGRGLDYVFGLGSVVAGAGADAVLVARAQRPCMLGQLVITTTAAPMDIAIRSITVNGIELQGGAALAEQSAGCFSPQCTDDDGCVLGFPVSANDTVQIMLHNWNAAAITVSAGCFVLPSGAM